jgi:hypothetical protein
VLDMTESSITAWMGAGEERAAGAPELSALRSEFPFLRFAWGRPAADLRLEAWRAPGFDFWSFDRRFDERRGERFRFVLQGEGAHLERALGQVLTRLQRLFMRRNRHSADESFERLLQCHAAKHDLRRPLVRADYDHALDVWQWVLRLDPDASVDVQAAALLHDIERLDTEAERRIEHRYGDYRAFKAEHAARGAAGAVALVRQCGFSSAIAGRVGELVRAHESPSSDAAVQVLNDADALSFFSLNAPGFMAYFPREHLVRKVEVALARMSASAQQRLSSIRMPAMVASAVALRSLRGPPPAASTGALGSAAGP